MYSINQAAARAESIIVDAETAAILNYADSCYRNSEGLFDITSGVLRQVWDFKSGQLPDKVKLEQCRKKVGWNKLQWNNPILEFSERGMELDFGGIVKEYAADQCAVACMNQGIHNGLINLGGDIRVFGPHPDDRPWTIGIRHPRTKQAVISNIAVRQGGISSSGDYERCIKIDNRYYSHILNPKTGWPVMGMASVTVIADFCLVAGSAGTIAMLKEDKGKSWLYNNEFKALAVDINGNIFNTINSIISD